MRIILHLADSAKHERADVILFYFLCISYHTYVSYRTLLHITSREALQTALLFFRSFYYAQGVLPEWSSSNRDLACRFGSHGVDLYVRRLSPGDPLPINVERIEINDDAPLDEEIRIAASKLSNGRMAGASRMRVEHVREGLQNIHREEDPEELGGSPGDGRGGCVRGVSAATGSLRRVGG